MMDLNQHGAGSRCLLRLRENEGEPGLSDAAFIARFLPRYPEWRERPGAADVSTLLELAKELRLAGRIEISRDYGRVMAAHRVGQSVLVCTERVPEQNDFDQTSRQFVMLLVKANDEAFTLWCPYPNGQSDVLPSAARCWWDKWQSIGIVLHRP